MKRFAFEILTQWSMASMIILKSVVSIGTERTRQDSNISKDRLERLIQNIRHLVLEVLGCNKWIK